MLTDLLQREGILIAIIAALSSLGVALISTLRQGRHTLNQVDQVKETLGEANGQGNLVEMAEQLLRGQSVQDHRLLRLEDRTANIHEKIVHMDDRVEQLEAQRHERDKSARDKKNKEKP